MSNPLKLRISLRGKVEQGYVRNWTDKLRSRLQSSYPTGEVTIRSLHHEGAFEITYDPSAPVRRAVDDVLEGASYDITDISQQEANESVSAQLESMRESHQQELERVRAEKRGVEEDAELLREELEGARDEASGNRQLYDAERKERGNAEEKLKKLYADPVCALIEGASLHLRNALQSYDSRVEQRNKRLLKRLSEKYPDLDIDIALEEGGKAWENTGEYQEANPMRESAQQEVDFLKQLRQHISGQDIPERFAGRLKKIFGEQEPAENTLKTYEEARQHHQRQQEVFRAFQKMMAEYSFADEAKREKLEAVPIGVTRKGGMLDFYIPYGEHPFFERLLDFVKSHIGEDVSVTPMDDIAMIENVSGTHLTTVAQELSHFSDDVVKLAVRVHETTIYEESLAKKE